MGSSPQIPQYQAPSGAPSFTPSAGVDPSQYISAMQNQTTSPGSSNISSVLGASGLGATGAAGTQTPEGQAIMANQINYAMSDADFAQRYPQMIQAQQSYLGNLNNLLGTQTPQSMAAGNSLSNAGQSMMGTGANVISSGQSLANQAQPFINAGQSFIAPSQQMATNSTNAANNANAFSSNVTPIAQGLAAGSGALGANATAMGAQAQAIGQPDITLGQNLISGNQAIDPVVQQELMRSGLSSAASSLGGAAALGGQAGQAAVGRNLGVGAENWIAQQRAQGQALQQTGAGLTSAYAGGAGSLAGASGALAGGANTLTGAVGNLANVSGTYANAANALSNAGSGFAGTGTNIANAGTSMINAGTGVANAGTNAMTGGQNIINSAQQNANAGFGLASSMFQPRSFGLQGTDAANINLSNTAGLNNMMQYLYSTKVQGAQYNTQIAAQNAGAQAQSSGNLISGGAGAASAAAVGVAFAMSCHVARRVYGQNDPRWRVFRLWLHFNSPEWLKNLYMRYSWAYASRKDIDPEVLYDIRKFMDDVMDRNRGCIRFRYLGKAPSLPLAA